MLLLARISAIAGDTLTVASRFYHIDHGKKIILINQALNELNAQPAVARLHLSLDRVYTLSQPITTVATDTSYKAQYANTAYRVYFTQLPVVHLTTRHQIADTPSVYAQFSLVEPTGRLVESALGVEYRGATSQTYPKKSYELSFWADTTGASSRDVSLLGMRTDNKYNLQAMYNEPLRFRSKTANALWQEVHQIYYKNLEPDAKNGIAMEYTEVFFNGQYQGVYTLTERVDRKQLKLKKYNNGITGELYKGYHWSAATTFTTLPPIDNTSETWGDFEYKHPEEKIDWTNLYNFVDFVENSTDAAFYSSYRQKFHLGNAVDYYLFLNLTRATDNTGKNLYIAKYKQGEPYYYVPWDLDGVFGTDWQGLNTGTVNDILSNGFYNRLIQDCSPNGFRATLRTRWQTLRTSVLTEENIMGKFRANYARLATNNVYEREQLAWVGFQADTTQLPYISSWLHNRLTYLDNVFTQSCTALATQTAQANSLMKLYPNPAQNYVLVDFEPAPYELSIRDLRGRVVLQTSLKGAHNRVNTQHLARGVYAVTLRSATQVATQKLVIE